MKNKWWILFIVAAIWFSNSHALAGDAISSIYSNREPQDALFIGKVIKIENDSILHLSILRVICGEIEESQIKYYHPTAAQKTSVGRYVLLSVEKEGDFYKKCYSVCHEVVIEEVDKISAMTPLDQERDEDMDISLQWFCNTGTEIGDATDSGKYYLYEEDGVISKTLVYDMKMHKWLINPLSAEYSSPNTQKSKRTNIVLIGFVSVAIVFLLVGCVVWLKRRKTP